MEKSTFNVVIGTIALYGVVAVICFMFLYGPTTGPAQIPATLVYCGLVAFPYALLALAVHFSSNQKANLWIGRTSTVVILLSLWAYSSSFSPNDGEHVIAYMLTPALQSPFVLIALGISLWSRYRRPRAIPDDPRIKRVLKRYRKNDNLVDATTDVSHIRLDKLLSACSCSSDKDLVRPKQLDDRALVFFSKKLADVFNPVQYDFFLHSYVRTEFVTSYYSDPTVTSRPPPENGPPAKIPLPEGTHWVSVRPKEGNEHYEAYNIPGSSNTQKTPTVH